jgi:hypothetical protein
MTEIKVEMPNETWHYVNGHKYVSYTPDVRFEKPKYWRDDKRITEAKFKKVVFGLDH